jgi:hypothetical protein
MGKPNQIKDLMEVVKPFGNLSSRILPAGSALGYLVAFSSDDRAHSSDSKSLNSESLLDLRCWAGAAHVVCSATVL